jgi:hypothetical protein
MKILLLGNSLVGCLLDAYRPDIHLGGYHVAFIVVPGADGPDLMISEDRLHPRDAEQFPHNPPFCWPSAAWLEELKNQDAVVIGALGFLDDPQFPGASLFGSFMLPSFRVRDGLVNPPPPVTRSVAAASLRGQWSTQPGAMFSKKLRQFYAGRILVLPYPAPARSTLKDHSCHLAQIYEEPSDAAHFFESLRQNWLTDWCRENRLDLLELRAPDPENLLTPDHLLAADRFHMAPSLSDLILRQIDKCLDVSRDG